MVGLFSAADPAELPAVAWWSQYTTDAGAPRGRTPLGDRHRRAARLRRAARRPARPPRAAAASSTTRCSCSPPTTASRARAIDGARGMGDRRCTPRSTRSACRSATRARASSTSACSHDSRPRRCGRRRRSYDDGTIPVGASTSMTVLVCALCGSRSTPTPTSRAAWPPWPGCPRTRGARPALLPVVRARQPARDRGQARRRVLVTRRTPRAQSTCTGGGSRCPVRSAPTPAATTSTTPSGLHDVRHLAEHDALR